MSLVEESPIIMSLSILARKLANLMHSVLAFFLYYSGVFALFRFLYLKHKVTIVFYHEVATEMVLHKSSLFITKDNFERQLRYLSKNFSIISIDDLIAYSPGSRSEIPKYPLIITFDGGYEGNLLNAYPILKRYKAKSTVYLITDCIDRRKVHRNLAIYFLFEKTDVSRLTLRLGNSEHGFQLSNAWGKKLAESMVKEYLEGEPDDTDRILSILSDKLNVGLSDCYNAIRPLTWEDIRAKAQDDLISFGAHTVNHLSLTDMDLERAEFEIRNCKEVIESNVNIVVRSFCYPNGRVSDEIKNIVRESGYSLAISTESGFNNIRNPDMYALKRIGMENESRSYMFASKLYGFSGLLSKMAGEMRKAVTR